MDVLLKHSPDIIATQEGRINQLKDMEQGLKDFKLVDQHRSWIGERMYPSFFIRSSAFEYLSSGDKWLSETPDIAGSVSFESTFPRLMTWTSLQIKNTTQKLMLVNTHLDHIKPETRVHQARVLTHEIKRSWKGECPLIIMGDFNEGPAGTVRAVLLDEFENLKDAWQLFNTEEETSHHAFKGESQNGSRIDWILVGGKLKIESCKMDKTSRNGLYPTDHFPIVSNISL